MRKIGINIILLITIFTLTCCSTSIRRILKHPAKFHGKTVRVKGTVVSSLELEGLRAFSVRSGRNTITIVTKAYVLPVLGDKVKIKGKVDAKFKYQRSKITVIKEKMKTTKDTSIVPPIYKNKNQRIMNKI